MQLYWYEGLLKQKPSLAYKKNLRMQKPDDDERIKAWQFLGS